MTTLFTFLNALQFVKSFVLQGQNIKAIKLLLFIAGTHLQISQTFQASVISVGKAKGLNHIGSTAHS
jgi:hypothetical protein